MHIGFDGKRAYQNKTGLGNYIRSLLAILTEHYPQHQYTLFAPEQTSLFNTGRFKNVDAIFPESFAGKQFPGWWRRAGMMKQAANAGLDLYHGVSNELPVKFYKTGIKSVVTIHDIIYERFPETYNFDERYVHRFKIKQACRDADAIITISKQTREDLIHFYNVPENKIFVSYQSCNPIFQQTVDEAYKQIVKKRYQLPDQYFLFVSSIAPRKNLIAVCKAMAVLKDKIAIPLVVIGNGKKEKEDCKKFMYQNGLSSRLILLNETEAAKGADFTTAKDFPAIYQQALALVYPSIFEGFGAPLLEALWSGLPVISSNTSSLPEVGGDAALYFSPHNYEELAQHMLSVASNNTLVENLRGKGFQQAQHFTTRQYADSIMDIYNKLV